MNIKRFIKRLATKVVIFTVVMIIIGAITQSVSPLVTNDLALSQMQNYDESFVIMNAYNKIRPIFTLMYVGISIWFTSTVARDIYKFVKNNKTENEKGEN